MVRNPPVGGVMADARRGRGVDSADDDRRLEHRVETLEADVAALRDGLVYVAEDTTKSNRRGIINRSLIVLLVLGAFASSWVLQNQNDRLREQGERLEAQNDRIDEGRRAGSLYSCRGDQDQDNVLRAIFRQSIENPEPQSRAERARLRRLYRQIVKRPATGKSQSELLEGVVDRVMEPLGGYRTTRQEQATRCEKRLRRSNLKP